MEPLPVKLGSGVGAAAYGSVKAGVVPVPGVGFSLRDPFPVWVLLPLTVNAPPAVSVTLPPPALSTL